LEKAVWASPPPDVIRRRWAVDGTGVVHEFTYSRPDAQNADVTLHVVTRQQFQQGAYYAELDFRTAD
jgi:hypothetical protein